MKIIFPLLGLLCASMAVSASPRAEITIRRGRIHHLEREMLCCGIGHPWLVTSPPRTACHPGGL